MPLWFTDEENNIIEKGVKKELSWYDIAQKCNKKTANQCSRQWRKIVQFVPAKKVPWTKEEDEIIRSGIKNKLCWKDISKLTKRRSSAQCSVRWRFVLNPSIKRFVKWTKEEDRILINLRTTYPNMTNKEISTYLPGRTNRQCWSRWFEHLNPDLRHGEFTEEEDAKILQLRNNLQGWSKMIKHTALMGRSPCAIKNRWRKLQTKERRKKRLASTEKEKFKKKQKLLKQLKLI